MPDEWDLAKTRVLTDNTAQGVFKYLRLLESNRALRLTRWLWELLQNARDVSASGDTSLIASIEYGQGYLVFRHNGRKFSRDEITHLIYYGSTKVGEDETVGQFGSGFLTTHLLSLLIDVSGQLEGDQSFRFNLQRDGDSPTDLRNSMDRSWEDFKASLSPSTGSPPGKFTTCFRYPIVDGATDAVESGIETLQQCGPFVVAFNQEFGRIEVHSPEGTKSLEVIERLPLQDGLKEIRVVASKNGVQIDSSRKYVLAEDDKIFVAVSLERMNGDWVCLPSNSTPKLFLGFPLIGTEDFSFPAVINSFRLTPATEERDSVALGLASDKTNHENEAVILGACKLLVNLIQFAASSGWGNVYALADIPPIAGQNRPTKDWLQKCLNKQLIERIRQIPAVLCELGPIIPKESILPFAEKDVGVKALWDLLDGLEEFQQKLPRRNEAVGWCDAIKSWATVCDCQATSFDEAFDGCKLTSYVEKRTKNADEEYGRLENLQKLLREDVCAVEWLDQLYKFLKDDGLKEVIRTQSIILDQGGLLDRLSNLHRDQDIAEELKDIAELLEWNIRWKLRDKRLTSLADEVGAEDWDSQYVVRELVKKLQERADEKPDDDFAKASSHLFKWIVGQKKWDLLRSFPVFAESSESDSRRAFRLERRQPEEDDNRPLAPIGAWAEELKQFSDLFPQRQILADAFFEAVPDPDTWRILDEQGFIRTNVVIRREVSSDTEFSDRTFRLKGPLSGDGDTKHRTFDCITVTDIAFLTGIMARVRQSPRRAYLFWRFLTEWLVKEDVQGLEVKESRCACKRTHQHFQAAWLVQVGENHWIRLGDTYFQATAQSLANLLRDSEWKPSSLNENPAAVKLLEAIGVTRFDLMREFVAETPKTRTELDNAFTDILLVAGGNVDHLSRAREYIEDLKDDEKLPDILKKRREDRQMVQKNQHLGQLGEELMKKSLEDKGFTVTRTGTGSDYEIKLSSGDQSWLVEVKSTQGQEVRMTDTQARKAVEKEDGFLLCVVPVESETPALDEVRDKMRFVENIGSLVEPLCNGLDEFEDLRDEITDDKSSGVQLVVEAGTARVRVAKSVWDKGFRLEDLSKKLK